MKILDIQTVKSVLTVTILIEASEFVFALNKAYQDNKEKLRISGWHDGMAPREELERVYGPNILYDEALDRTIPILYKKFISNEQITQVDQPEIIEVTWNEDGSVSFTIQVAIYPSVCLGQYKGLNIQAPSGEDSYADAVLNEAARRMDADIPEGMIERKLEAMISKEKLRINQDAIYNVLADTVEILARTYRAAGVARPTSQVRQESMDIMLQTMSADQGEPSEVHFCDLLTESVQRYRELPTDFNKTLNRMIQERGQERQSMSPEDRISEVFSAYLGSLNMTEQEWFSQHRIKAAGLVRRDLLLDAVAKAERIEISAIEMEAAYLHFAEQCGINIEQVKGTADPESLEWQLKRDKAERLILDSANRIEA